MDPIVFRGIERLIIAFGGIFFGYLGYRLFIHGITTKKSDLKFESAGMNIVFSGTGPGLFFMIFGGIILITSLYSGGVSVSEKTSYDSKVETETLSKSDGSIESENAKKSDSLKESKTSNQTKPTRETRTEMGF
ncbi:hypothetical protein EHQ81_19345 [Leptospira selangorensis]|uniref:Uncharacterized protein n=1 Tax=Leptospira selangorensis TaxID=2484982 RepID=A0A5F2C6E3_9LEPT|nr:hypothetical protein [Leptospira selangorensis]TGM10265.1 hypothetical protein EHQ81_19345 [Leptospira selangorensis]TGM27926.1 hypothetical protein EHQ82_01520 [Leptospira selangorensis]